MGDKSKLSKQGEQSPCLSWLATAALMMTSQEDMTMPQLSTGDLGALATHFRVPFEFLSMSDGLLLRLTLHEALHLYHQGKFKEVYDGLPNDLAVKFLTDSRVIQWLIDNSHVFLPQAPKLTLAERLENYAEADIWVDANGDDVVSDMLDDAQAAMLQAAKLLREHGLDK